MFENLIESILNVTPNNSNYSNIFLDGTVSYNFIFWELNQL